MSEVWSSRGLGEKCPSRDYNSGTGSVSGVDLAHSLAPAMLLLLHQGRYVRWVCTAGLRNSALIKKYVSSPIFKLLGVPCFWEVL